MTRPVQLGLLEGADKAVGPMLGEAQEAMLKHRLWCEQELWNGTAKEGQRDREDVPRARPAGRRPDPVERPRPEERPDPTPRREPSRPTVQGSAPATDLGKGERVILTAVAQYNAGVTREQLTVFTGYKRSSRDTYLQRLKAAGLVEADSGRLLATAVGIEALGDFEPLPTGAALREHWLTPKRLPDGERNILSVLIDAYPNSVPKTDLDDATGYKRSSRDTYLQRLRARQLVTTNGDPRAADTLFVEVGRG